MLSKRNVGEMGSNAKIEDHSKSGKKANNGNYFLTADVSNVLKAINLNMEASQGKKNTREMTEDDIDKLFSGSNEKKKKGEK